MTTLDTIQMLLSWNGKTRTQLAESLGMSRIAVQMWWQDKSKSYEAHISDIARFFDCNTFDLLKPDESAYIKGIKENMGFLEPMNDPKAIKDELLTLGKSQKELCDYLKINRSTFTHWLNGSVKSYTDYLPEIREFLSKSKKEMLSPDQDGETIVRVWKLLSKKNREIICDLMKTMVDKNEGE